MNIEQGFMIYEVIITSQILNQYSLFLNHFGIVIYSPHVNKKRVSSSYRTATTFYPCCLPTLGEFKGSWSYKTYPVQM